MATCVQATCLSNTERERAAQGKRSHDGKRRNRLVSAHPEQHLSTLATGARRTGVFERPGNVCFCLGQGHMDLSVHTNRGTSAEGSIVWYCQPGACRQKQNVFRERSKSLITPAFPCPLSTVPSPSPPSSFFPLTNLFVFMPTKTGHLVVHNDGNLYIDNPGW